MGEVAQTVTTGQRVIPFKLLEKGFKFKYPFIYKALEDIRL
jgi:NAD dependent epimerase/dehydratase family enzyme